VKHKQIGSRTSTWIHFPLYEPKLMFQWAFPLTNVRVERVERPTAKRPQVRRTADGAEVDPELEWHSCFTAIPLGDSWISKLLRALSRVAGPSQLL
jgi:hypothetical protein